MLESIVVEQLHIFSDSILVLMNWCRASQINQFALDEFLVCLLFLLFFALNWWQEARENVVLWLLVLPSPFLLLLVKLGHHVVNVLLRNSHHDDVTFAHQIPLAYVGYRIQKLFDELFRGRTAVQGELFHEEVNKNWAESQLLTLTLEIHCHAQFYYYSRWERFHEKFH